MGFFDLPEREPENELEVEDEDASFEGGRPGRWIAGVVAVELLVARSDHAAVVVNRISAYPDGFELTVNSYLRGSPKRGQRRRSHHPMMWHGMGEQGEPLPHELLRFGLAWPDGGRARNVDDWGRSWPDATEPAHGLESHSGGGSDVEFSQEYWAWPLPGSGPLELVVEWPAYDIDETLASIDGELLIAAADRARPVWPEDSSRVSHISRAAIVRAARERHDEADGAFTDG